MPEPTSQRESNQVSDNRESYIDSIQNMYMKEFVNVRNSLPDSKDSMMDKP